MDITLAIAINISSGPKICNKRRRVKRRRQTAAVDMTQARLTMEMTHVT